MKRGFRTTAVAAATCVALGAGVGCSSQPSALASLSGDSGRLVFTWRTDPKGVTTEVVATTRADGSGRRVVAGCDYGCHHTSGDWSPDGRRLVYVEQHAEGGGALVTVRADGSGRTVLYEAGRAKLSSPAWSPDGLRIAFAEYRFPRKSPDWTSDLFVVARDGTGLTRVTRTPRQAEDDVAWSSQGRLAFRSSPGRFQERRYELFTAEPDGTGLRRLTSNAVSDSQPDWAPGGRRLVFVRGGDVWAMTVGSGAVVRLAAGHSPTWSPDGSAIAYVGADDGQVHLVSPSGEGDTTVGSPGSKGSVAQLDWQRRQPARAAASAAAR